MDNLFLYGDNGVLIGVSKAIFDEGIDLIVKFKSFENSSLKVSTQFVIQASRDELLKRIEKIHFQSVEKQFKEKLDIIESLSTCLGDFIFVVDSVNTDNHKSKTTVILRVATKGVSSTEKVYDVFVHSVSFQQHVSTAQVAIMSASTVAVVGIAGSMGVGVGLPLFIGGAGCMYGALQVRPQMPDYIDHAINMLMIDSLKSSGWLIEQGTEYVLKKPVVPAASF